MNRIICDVIGILDGIGKSILYSSFEFKYVSAKVLVFLIATLLRVKVSMFE